ncbi:hypothetical protein QBC47DRAFT_417548 [Echria macrotheca]|uniref:LysM domain-containing protein n=1 Tax=Echria macrotheca TaxID=438768 RepID=A0AAJ0B661_9PEZI|nr:hypothetical protein QBC47DRAFT_417548 [Echria macrotheca]
MKQQTIVLHLSWLGRVLAISRRQLGPIDPSTDKDCTFYAEAIDKTYTCKYIEEENHVSHSDFVAWNPSVKSDCSGIKVGNSYCVEVNFGEPRTTLVPTPTTTTTTLKTSTSSSKSSTKPTTTPTSTTTTRKQTTPTPTPTPTTPGPAKPSPTQAGLISTCTSFYQAQKGDTCWALANQKFPGTFSLDDFYAWNPAVHTDCSGLQAGGAVELYVFCAGVDTAWDGVWVSEVL